MQILTNDLPDPIVARLIWTVVEASEKVAIRTNDKQTVIANSGDVRVLASPYDHRYLVSVGGPHGATIYFDDLLTVESYR